MQVNNRNTQISLHFVKRNVNTKVKNQLILILSQLFRLKLFNLFLGFPIHFITLELFLPPHQPWRDLPPSSEGIPHPLRKITAFTCAQTKNTVASSGDILISTRDGHVDMFTDAHRCGYLHYPTHVGYSAIYADNADIDADIRIRLAIPNIHPCSRNTQQAEENSHDAWLHLGPAAAAGISISFSRLKLMKSVAGAKKCCRRGSEIEIDEKCSDGLIQVAPAQISLTCKNGTNVGCYQFSSFLRIL